MIAVSWTQRQSMTDKTRLIMLSVASLLIGNASAQVTVGVPFFSTPAERCILPASQYHSVNPYILRAILKVESSLKPTTVSRNSNDTVDIGIGGINSKHLPELSKYGVTPDNLKDACVGTYVAAWHLSSVIRRHGNTWFGVASYHSTTPYFNNRYQILLNNELVGSGTLEGTLYQVPPLRQSQSELGRIQSNKSTSKIDMEVASSGVVVFDER